MSCDAITEARGLFESEDASTHRFTAGPHPSNPYIRF